MTSCCLWNVRQEIVNRIQAFCHVFPQLYILAGIWPSTFCCTYGFQSADPFTIFCPILPLYTSVNHRNKCNG